MVSKPVRSIPTMNLPNPAVSAPLAGIPGAGNFADGNAIRLGFMQLPCVQNLLPFITSLTLHATIIIVGLLTIQTIRILKAPLGEPQITIADTTIVEGPPGEVPNVGPHDDPFRRAAQLDPTIGTPEGFADRKGPTVDLRAAGADGADAADLVIGPGPGSTFGSKRSHFGPGSGDASGPPAPFGAPGGGAIGPKGPVFGCPTSNARTIVFVCDCTGSMINKFQSLKVELAKAVMGLKPIQSFTVIFYQDEGFRVWQKQLTPATPENKRLFSAWMNDITTSGQTDPLPAIELGLKIHPQLMYFLTDAADFPDTNAVVQLFRKGNADKKIKVNTILFVESSAEEEKNKESEPLMRGIAKENGGVFKWVRLDELD